MKLDNDSRCTPDPVKQKFLKLEESYKKIVENMNQVRVLLSEITKLSYEEGISLREYRWFGAEDHNNPPFEDIMEPVLDFLEDNGWNTSSLEC